MLNTKRTPISFNQRRMAEPTIRFGSSCSDIPRESVSTNPRYKIEIIFNIALSMLVF